MITLDDINDEVEKHWIHGYDANVHVDKAAWMEMVGAWGYREWLILPIRVDELMTPWGRREVLYGKGGVLLWSACQWCHQELVSPSCSEYDGQYYCPKCGGRQ